MAWLISSASENLTSQLSCAAWLSAKKCLSLSYLALAGQRRHLALACNICASWLKMALANEMTGKSWRNVATL
jgi:hypothetical protein